MAEIKLVAESLQEYTQGSILNEETLNESAKGKLEKFVKNPDKKQLLIAAFARQIGKTKGLKDAILKLSPESQQKIAQQALAVMQKDSSKGYPWIKIKDGKIVGAGALGMQKSETGKELGA